MKTLLLVLAGGLSFYGYVPYIRDILRGDVRPARSARLMFALLLVITFLQQHQLGSGWLLVFTATEAAGSLLILAFALRFGVGGLKRLDVVCYGLLLIDVLLWQTSNNALLALHLSVLADLIAFTPTLVKTWHEPWTETPFFFVTGVIAPVLNILGAGRYSYAVLLFPVYISVVNLLETGFIYGRRNRVPRPAAQLALDTEGPTRL